MNAGHLELRRLPCVLVENNRLLPACGAFRRSFSAVCCTVPSPEKGFTHRMRNTNGTVCAYTGVHSCLGETLLSAAT